MRDKKLALLAMSQLHSLRFHRIAVAAGHFHIRLTPNSAHHDAINYSVQLLTRWRRLPSTLNTLISKNHFDSSSKPSKASLTRMKISGFPWSPSLHAKPTLPVPFFTVA